MMRNGLMWRTTQRGRRAAFGVFLFPWLWWCVRPKDIQKKKKKKKRIKKKKKKKKKRINKNKKEYNKKL
jgi:hypothetical protein